MKQYIWMIKVWDLLHTIWGTDTIIFENRYVHELENITEPGISWEIYLQTLNNMSIQITVIKLTCIMNDISDISWKEYTREVLVENYEAVCIIPIDSKNIDDVYQSYQDIYEINNHNFTVNLENLIINAIKSQEPIVKIKNDENLWDWWIEVVDIPPI